MQRVRDALVSERQALLEGLQGITFLQPYPSHANFILCKVSGSMLRDPVQLPGVNQTPGLTFLADAKGHVASVGTHQSCRACVG